MGPTLMTRFTKTRDAFSFTILRAALAVACLAGLAAGDIPVRADVVYVANTNSNTIEKITSGGVSSVFVTIGLDHPTGVAFDGAGSFSVGGDLSALRLR